MQVVDLTLDQTVVLVQDAFGIACPSPCPCTKSINNTLTNHPLTANPRSTHIHTHAHTSEP